VAVERLGWTPIRQKRGPQAPGNNRGGTKPPKQSGRNKGPRDGAAPRLGGQALGVMEGHAGSRRPPEAAAAMGTSAKNWAGPCEEVRGEVGKECR